MCAILGMVLCTAFRIANAADDDEYEIYAKLFSLLLLM